MLGEVGRRVQRRRVPTPNNSTSSVDRYCSFCQLGVKVLLLVDVLINGALLPTTWVCIRASDFLKFPYLCHQARVAMRHLRRGGEGTSSVPAGRSPKTE